MDAAAGGQKREGEAPPAGEQPPSKKPTLEGQQPEQELDSSDSDSEAAAGRPSGTAGGDGERQWLVAGAPKAVRIGDNFQATLPPLAGAAPAPPPQQQEGNGSAATRASEFHEGPVDLDEDGLGSGSRMYQ